MLISLIANSARARTPLIQFPVRVPWLPTIQGAILDASSLSTNQVKSGTVPVTSSILPTSSTGWSVPDTIDVFRVIPDRFKRRPIDPLEIEFITRGGPE